MKLSKLSNSVEKDKDKKLKKGDKITHIQQATRDDNSVHIEQLSCGHVNNQRLNKTPSGECPKGDLDVNINRVEYLYFDRQLGEVKK